MFLLGIKQWMYNKFTIKNTAILQLKYIVVVVQFEIVVKTLHFW